MNQHSTVPEFILAESEKTALTGKLQANLSRDYLACLADSEVLLKELQSLVLSFSNITSSLRMLELSVQEQP